MAGPFGPPRRIPGLGGMPANAMALADWEPKGLARTAPEGHGEAAAGATAARPDFGGRSGPGGTETQGPRAGPLQAAGQGDQSGQAALACHSGPTAQVHLPAEPGLAPAPGPTHPGLQQGWQQPVAAEAPTGLPAEQALVAAAGLIPPDQLPQQWQHRTAAPILQSPRQGTETAPWRRQRSPGEHPTAGPGATATGGAGAAETRPKLADTSPAGLKEGEALQFLAATFSPPASGPPPPFQSGPPPPFEITPPPFESGPHPTGTGRLTSN